MHPRKRSAPDYSILQFIDGHSSAREAFNPETCCDRYLVMYYETLDSVLSSIKYRFIQPSFVAYQNIETLLLKAINSEDIYDEMRYGKEVRNGEINRAQFMIAADLLQVFSDKKRKT